MFNKMKNIVFIFSIFFFITVLNSQTSIFSSLPVIIPDAIANTADYQTDISTDSYEDNSEQSDEQDITEVEEGGEYGDDIFVSTEPVSVPEPVNLGGDGKITLTRNLTGESISVVYRNPDGTYNKDAFEEIKGIMRCSYTGREIETPAKLVELLDAIEDKFSKKNGLIILSGYRTKPLNSITEGSSKNSMHMLGWAADIRIKNVSARKIKDFAKKLDVGGVGYYPTMNFVHVDIGKVRYWEKLPKRHKSKKAISKNSKHKSKRS